MSYAQQGIVRLGAHWAHKAIQINKKIGLIGYIYKFLGLLIEIVYKWKSIVTTENLINWFYAE